ncbi:hypothetical protein [Streptomyces sp. NRRL B-24720]|uniref:hypothetical protein n=1 Tax=Streptomyces sp. NRRL B-24720 TaxID=1476876 RepID=UPI001F278559|nr:hypothetical protein [Streptomyces sp. NRRL B-24720]
MSAACHVRPDAVDLSSDDARVPGQDQAGGDGVAVVIDAGGEGAVTASVNRHLVREEA